MGNEKFAALVAQSQKELVEKNNAQYMVHGFDRFAKWKFEKELGLLIYSNPDGFKAVVPVQLAGTLQTANGEWLWGWANQAVPESIKADAKQVRAWGEQNGVPTLTNASSTFSAPQAMALLAVTVHLVDARGGIGVSLPKPDGYATNIYFSFRQVYTTREDDLGKIQEMVSRANYITSTN